MIPKRTRRSTVGSTGGGAPRARRGHAVHLAVEAAKLLPRPANPSGDAAPPLAAAPPPARSWDQGLGAWSVPVMPGEVYVTADAEVITTVLGSCVSACVRHPGTGAGGMNHVVLAGGGGASLARGCEATASLDRLLAGVLAYGGSAAELEIKLFGGSHVIEATARIGRHNVEAVRRYFAAHRLTIAASDVGGGVARRLRYAPRTGDARIRRTVMRDTGWPSTV